MRFVPTRAGVINLWDYRDEEFLFVDGWLILRGPNGSGKTKALEVLFPFVLDGRIEPRRLNPFASEDRTMKSNLLYRGQESAHAYVWMEFANVGEYVTIGIGLRAHRHVDRVTRWHFVVDGRVGVDFSLIDADDRPLNRKHLIAEVGPDAVSDSADDYRRMVDTRLFGLGAARYEQLLDLVLTLRKPQLAKDLNPVLLSRTLQRGLRPVDDQLLVEAAGSFDDMEAVARTLEGLIAADTATTGFLGIYSTYLRTHARWAADALAGRLAVVNERRAALDAAAEALTAAGAAEADTADRLSGAEGVPAQLRAHLDSLRSSAAYQSHEQLADLERHVHDLATATTAAAGTTAAEADAAAKRQRESVRAGEEEQAARATVARYTEDLRADAEAAGIGWAPADAVSAGLGDRVSARVSARREDVTAVRQLAARLAETDRDHTRALADLASTSAAVTAAEEAERHAEAATAQVRQQVRVSVTEWLARHQRLVRDLAVPELSGRLDVAVDTVGEPGAATLREVYGEVIADGVASRRDEQATLTARGETLAGRRTGLVADRDRIAAEHDDAPPVPATRPAARTDRPGAALWQLVRFADDVTGEQAAAVEAALHAAGLLDAWVHPDPDATVAALADRVHDGYLLPLAPQRRPAGRTLSDVLVPEAQDAVAAATIGAVLSSIALVDDVTVVADTPPTTIDRAGGYVQGVGIGSHTKPAAEYIGATARAARRAARIAEYDRLLAELDAEIDAVEQARTALTRLLAEVDAAAAALPSVAGIHTALRELDRAAAVVRAQQTAAEVAAARLDQAVAERSTAAANLRRGTSERSLPAERVDEVADAVGRFERSGMRLEAADDATTKAAGAAVEATQRYEEAVARHAAAEQAAREAVARHAEKDEAFRTLRSAIGAAAEQVLAEVAQVSDDVVAAEARLSALRAERAVAQQAVASARTRVEMGEQARADAAREAQADSLRLRPYAHPDLLSLLRCPVDLRWPARLDEGGVDPQVAALHEAILAATKELNPTEVSLKQSATRLTTALTELQAQLPAAGLDHRPEWDTDDGVIVVRIADEQGLTPVAHFGERIARQRRDQEQLLTEAEQRVLEDALLGQLARQIHHRTIDARDLVEGMDTQMRARRMSSGLTVGVGWQLADDLDADQREACKLLERDPARLGPSQLTTLRRHFATRIKAARATAPEQPYRELLAQVLDYRQWRVFAFTLHRPGGGTEALTRARHSQLSGGEQSVSLHLPLFAAANALFASARPDAPRLLGLDEAFAGVDENGRGELMSLATQFDLDLFMTGYDLWAAHSSVTGAAHYDLSHSAVHHAVSTVLLVWDGTANVADFDGTLARALGSPESRRAADSGAAVGAGSDDGFDE